MHRTVLKALAACIFIADVSLGDVWSERETGLRPQHGQGAPRVTDRARLAAHFGTQLDALGENDDWRRYDGLCRALEQLVQEGLSPVRARRLTSWRGKL